VCTMVMVLYMMRHAQKGILHFSEARREVLVSLRVGFSAIAVGWIRGRV
jgi:hypothetical protein